VAFIKEATMSNPFTYCELHTTDPKQATGFYGKLFDWKFEHMETPYGGYTSIGTGGTGVVAFQYIASCHRTSPAGPNLGMHAMR